MAKNTDTQKVIKTGGDDEAVIEAIEMIAKDSIIHQKHEGIWRVIQELFENTFNVSNPSGTKQISSKLLLQILWKVIYKMKSPDFQIFKSGPFDLHEQQADGSIKVKSAQTLAHDGMKREITEQIVTAGVTTVMKEGKFLDCLANKNGMFIKTGLFGNCPIHVGYDKDNSDYPISFRVGSLSDVYMNVAATGIRDPVGGLGADGVAVIYRYTMKTFESLFPEWKDKVAPGEIPRSNRYRKQLEKTWLQTTYQDNDMIEVCYYTSIEKIQVVFAGAACTVLEKLEDKEFPYMIDNKPYLPVLWFKFFPATEGLYDYGIGQMVYDLAVVTARMDNMAYSHANDNIYPITFINSPNKAPSKLFNEIMKAEEMRANSGKGYVVSENAQGSGSGVTTESFQSQPITQEWERAYHRLEQQIERLGFKLDMPDLGANPNEMSIMASQEATDGPIKEITELNGSEYQMAVEMTMEALRKFVPVDDMTPINSMVDIETPDMKMPMRGIPLGWVAEELRQNKYFVVVNTKEGVVQSDIMQLAKNQQAMQDIAPGSPAWNKMAVSRAKLLGQNITEDDLAMPQAPQAPQPGSPNAPANQPPQAETAPIDAVQLRHPGL